jgi:hypothetical protein
MIKLEHDHLSFTFPEIGRQVRARVDRHIEELLPKLLTPEERAGLLHELESGLGFRRRNAREQETIRKQARDLTATQIRCMLLEAGTRAIGMSSDAGPELTVTFHRTLRIPDDGRKYPLPASLGQFPLRALDDFAGTAPAGWLERGGVMMPMYQSEALWLGFSSSSYPFALKVAAGKFNAVSGDAWTPHLQADPQNYLVLPEQPWLDGFSVGKGIIRQFVAMPLGAGYSVEEQLTGKADIGGMQLQVYPHSAEAYFRDEVAAAIPRSLRELADRFFPKSYLRERVLYAAASPCMAICAEALGEESMGLGAGGTMRQEIYDDRHEFADWDQTQTRRCFVHLCNSLAWRQITGTNPPHPPLTSKEYQRARVPWFDYYRDDLQPLPGSPQLAGVKSIAQLGLEKNSKPLPDNSSLEPQVIVQYGNTRRPGEIREFVETA